MTLIAYQKDVDVVSVNTKDSATLVGMITSKARFPSRPTGSVNIVKNHKPGNTREHALITVDWKSRAVQSQESESYVRPTPSRSRQKLNYVRFI